MIRTSLERLGNRKKSSIVTKVVYRRLNINKGAARLLARQYNGNND
jgi:hypothetical protein